MQQSKKAMSVAGVCVAVALLIGVLANSKTPAPLSAAEQILVGTWETAPDAAGTKYTISYYPDRTCIWHGYSTKYPSQWRIEGDKLVLRHKYQTVIGGPGWMPAPIKSVELPSSMAKAETIRLPIALSIDGNTLNLGSDGSVPACELTRVNSD
jgi:hypothetical protein